MAQQHLRLGNYQPPDVDDDGYTPAYVTTSTSGSIRTQRGVMKNSVMFTIEGYDLKWSNLTSDEAKKILQEVMNKNSFSFFHYAVHNEQWETGDFYAANFNVVIDQLNEGAERVQELSFQVTSINPI